MGFNFSQFLPSLHTVRIEHLPLCSCSLVYYAETNSVMEKSPSFLIEHAHFRVQSVSMMTDLSNHFGRNFSTIPEITYFCLSVLWLFLICMDNKKAMMIFLLINVSEDRKYGIRF